MSLMARNVIAFSLLFVHVGSQGAGGYHCSCKGNRGVHGYCGYHINAFSNEHRPWCRTSNNCGQQSAFGSWTYCDERSVERRYYNGQWLTSRQFNDYYGSSGKRLYESSSNSIEQRKANDGNWYTAHQFRDFYINSDGERGWVEKWISAQQKSWNEYNNAYDSEQRQAKDGKWYTWREFQNHYGQQANEMWNNAGRSGHTGSSEQRQARDGKWYTWSEFQYQYGHQATEMWNMAGRSGSAERRQARDGKWYTWSEFENYYSHRAAEMWKNAGRSDL